jgi:hypothetical protein
LFFLLFFWVVVDIIRWVYEYSTSSLSTEKVREKKRDPIIGCNHVVVCDGHQTTNRLGHSGGENSKEKEEKGRALCCNVCPFYLIEKKRQKNNKELKKKKKIFSATGEFPAPAATRKNF